MGKVLDVARNRVRLMIACPSLTVPASRIPLVKRATPPVSSCTSMKPCKEMCIRDRYLINYRVETAARLLEETDLRIGHIARSVGYDDALLFSRQFKAKTGLSPSQARKRQKS